MDSCGETRRDHRCSYRIDRRDGGLAHRTGRRGDGFTADRRLYRHMPARADRHAQTYGLRHPQSGDSPAGEVARPSVNPIYDRPLGPNMPNATVSCRRDWNTGGHPRPAERKGSTQRYTTTSLPRPSGERSTLSTYVQHRKRTKQPTILPTNNDATELSSDSSVRVPGTASSICRALKFELDRIGASLRRVGGGQPNARRFTRSAVLSS